MTIAAQFAAVAASLLIASVLCAQDRPELAGRQPSAWDQAAPTTMPAPRPPLPPRLTTPPGQPPMPPPGGGPWQAPLPPPGAPGAPPVCAPPSEPGRHWDPLLRLLAERRPHIAERLTALRERDPERFEEVLAEALGARLERTLDDQNERKPPERSPGGRGPRERAGREHRPDSDDRVRELQDRQDQLEWQSRELAGELRRTQNDPLAAEDRQRMRDELSRTIDEQFDVRTELRRMELERLEHDLNRIQERLEHLRRDLERRQAERNEIIKRRLEQLTGDEGSGW